MRKGGTSSKSTRCRGRAWRSSQRAQAANAYVVLVTLAACTPHAIRKQDKPPVSVPKALRELPPSPPGSTRPLDAWWTSFGDAELDLLVARALDENKSLRAASQRVLQADATVRLARAGRLPTLGLGAEGSRQKVQTLFGSFENSLFSLSAAASYELDLFGRLKSAESAAKADALGSRFDLAAMRMSVAAQTVEAYFALTAARQQRELLEAREELNRAFLELTRLRYERGLIAALDVAQQEQEQASTDAALAQARGLERASMHALSALLAGYFSEGWSSTDEALPTLPPRPQLGLPSELIARRPDIQAARARLLAADHRIAQAMADRYPRLTLTGTLGTASTNLTTLFSDFVWSALGSIEAALFDGGRGRAEVDLARARYQELLETYGQTWIEALVEVERALALEVAEEVRLEAIERQLKATATVLTQSRDRYSQGLTDYLPVLTALSAQRSAERAEVEARQQRLNLRVQLYRALGTGFSAPGTVSKGETSKAGPSDDVDDAHASET